MTVRETASALRETRTIVSLATYDDYLDEAFCPLCGALVSGNVGTPSIPATLFDLEIGEEQLPVFGWKCDCRRADVAVVSPVEYAPENYTPVDVTIDGEAETVAVPTPVLQAASDEEVDHVC